MGKYGSIRLAEKYLQGKFRRLTLSTCPLFLDASNMEIRNSIVKHRSLRKKRGRKRKRWIDKRSKNNRNGRKGMRGKEKENFYLKPSLSPCPRNKKSVSKRGRDEGRNEPVVRESLMNVEVHGHGGMRGPMVCRRGGVLSSRGQGWLHHARRGGRVVAGEHGPPVETRCTGHRRRMFQFEAAVTRGG